MAMDEGTDNAKDPGPSVGRVDDSWLDNERRTLALVKACEVSDSEDDDYAIIARAGRFLNFLKTGA